MQEQTYLFPSIFRACVEQEPFHLAPLREAVWRRNAGTTTHWRNGAGEKCLWWAKSDPRQLQEEVPAEKRPRRTVSLRFAAATPVHPLNLYLSPLTPAAVYFICLFATAPFGNTSLRVRIEGTCWDRSIPLMVRKRQWVWTPCSGKQAAYAFTFALKVFLKGMFQLLWVLKAREILIISFEGVLQLFSATVLEANIDVFIKTMGYLSSYCSFHLGIIKILH
jgi:hypothetical protein